MICVEKLIFRTMMKGTTKKKKSQTKGIPITRERPETPSLRAATVMRLCNPKKRERRGLLMAGCGVVSLNVETRSWTCEACPGTWQEKGRMEIHPALLMLDY